MPAETVLPDAAQAKMTNDGYSYIDVRTEEEFAAGHPGGAFNVPVSLAGSSGMVPNPDFVAVMVKAFGKDAPVIMGCKTGARSARAGQMLLDAGFTKVLDQTAGWDGKKGSFGETVAAGWAKSGLPTDKGTPAAHSYSEMKSR